jgi:histidyl-tRNA synthetase
MLVGFLGSIGIRGDVEVLVNSLGSDQTRARYREALVAFLEPKKASLSETSQRRLASNPLRILDSKSKQDQDVLVGAPSIHDSFDDADRAVFESLQSYLRALGTPFRIDANLVRGLDYYNHTIFEIKGAAEKLGAGSTLVAGGRYNGMVHELGGPQQPAVGFAAGLERLVIASDMPADGGRGSVFVAPLGKTALEPALVLARDLRREGMACEADARGGSLKNMLGRADKLGARIALLLGENELAAGVVQMKDLATQTQESVPRDRVASVVAERLRTPVPAREVAAKSEGST